MGFAGRVEVAPAADEVEGILHRGSARGCVEATGGDVSWGKLNPGG
jgi:hypothetical protein